MEGEDCVIQVEDDGIGISPEKSDELNRAMEEVCYDTTVSESGSGAGSGRY